MLVHSPEEDFDYVYYSVVKPNDNSSFANCINELIDMYNRQDLNSMIYNADLNSNGLLSYLNEVFGELNNCSIEFNDDNNYVIKYRNIYSWITWTIDKNKCEFRVILGTNYSNSELGIYVYGSEDDDETISSPDFDIPDIPIDDNAMPSIDYGDLGAKILITVGIVITSMYLVKYCCNNEV